MFQSQYQVSLESELSGGESGQDGATDGSR